MVGALDECVCSKLVLAARIVLILRTAVRIQSRLVFDICKMVVMWRSPSDCSYEPSCLKTKLDC